MSSIAVIVNADDLGISQTVNEATFDLMAMGRISSATLLANAPAIREAARGASRFSRCSFGVHLNLTQFEPLTGGRGARLLVEARGQMSRATAPVRPRLDRLRAAYLELCAQIERVASLGVCVSHVDSHHHVHTRPALFPVLKAIQRRYRIRKVRLSKNFYESERPCPPGLGWGKRAYNRALKSVYLTQTTEAFTEFLTYYHAEPARKRSIRLIELMVHPGASDAAQEAAVLGSDWTAHSKLPIQLISYADLPPVRPVPIPVPRLMTDVRPCE